MTNVIILHGKPDDDEYYSTDFPTSSNSHWIPWLQKQCQLNELEVHAAEVHRVFDATYENWIKELTRYDINEETIIVGHSCGCGVLLRWLSENTNVRLKKLILVAPWLDPLGFMQKTFAFDLFDFSPDPKLLERIDSPIIFNSSDDMESIQKTLQKIKTYWPDFPVRTFENYGHFCKNDFDTEEFPELIEEILK